jgi:hypothetical protein
MNGASAEDSVKTIRSESNNKKSRMGDSHHFLDVLRKYHNSEKILSRLNPVI